MAIKKLQNNFTTAEQSKRLLELGLPADSADCYFTKSGKIEIKNTAFDILYTPCWSVGRLMEIYNTCIDSDKDEIKIPKGHFVLQRVLIEFFAALEYGWLNFTKLEE